MSVTVAVSRAAVVSGVEVANVTVSVGDALVVAEIESGAEELRKRRWLLAVCFCEADDDCVDAVVQPSSVLAEPAVFRRHCGRAC